MAKVNLYISNDAYEKINAIIEKRRQEGAREKMSVFQQRLQCFLNWVFVYMRLRWSAKSLHLIRPSLINYFLNAL